MSSHVGVAGVSARRPVSRATAAPDLRERLRRIVHEPEPWTIGILLSTGLLILFRHPIASAIGTAGGDLQPVAPTTTVAALPAAAPYRPPMLADVAVPTHAPRDPFAAWVAPNGATIVPPTRGPATTSARGSAPGPAAVTTPGGCKVAHVVAEGDSLWRIAAAAVGSTDADRVGRAVDTLYAANRAAIGADPALVQPGTRLCVPQGL